MLDARNERELPKEIGRSLERLAAPESLREFARNIDLHATGKTRTRLPNKKRPGWIGFAAGAAAVSLLFVSAEVSPAFAGMIKQIPGVSVAASWLDSIRSRDGVENAAVHQYTPFEPVAQQVGDMKVTLADVYLTSDKLTYKAFIRTDGLKDHLAKNPDGSLGLDRTAHFYAVESLDFKQIEGSGSKEVIADQETGDPILVISDTIELNAEEVRAFLAGNPDTLHFKLFASHDASGREVQEYAMNVPFSSSQWMKDRIIPVHQRLEIAGDPDIKELVLENIKITPLNTFAELRLDRSADYGLDLDLTGDAVRLTDDHGKTYPLKTYRTKYQPANENFQPGVIELAFNSSPFFDETVKSLTLHIGDIKVSDWTRSDSFTLSLNENMPKPIRFKGKEMAIAQARYEDGFLKLHVRQPEKDRMSVRFRIPTFQPEGKLRDTYYGEKADQRKDLLVPAEGTDAYDLSIMAPQQETYEIRMIRETDAVRIDRTLNIDLSP